jgi:hypothetical protein
MDIFITVLQNSKIVCLILVYLLVFLPNGVKVALEPIFLEFFNSFFGFVLGGTASLTLIAIIAENKLKTSFQFILLDNFIYYFFIFIFLITYKFSLEKIKNMSFGILVSCITGIYSFVYLYVVV